MPFGAALGCSCPRAAAAPPAAQELETMRVQNEQLAARLFTVEQRNSEMARAHGTSALARSSRRAHPWRPPLPPYQSRPPCHEEIHGDLSPAEEGPRRVL